MLYKSNSSANNDQWRQYDFKCNTTIRHKNAHLFNDQIQSDSQCFKVTDFANIHTLLCSGNMMVKVSFPEDAQIVQFDDGFKRTTSVTIHEIYDLAKVDNIVMFELHKHMEKLLKWIIIYGHVDLLEWCKQSNLEFKYDINPIQLAIIHKQTDIIKWFAWSGLNVKCTYVAKQMARTEFSEIVSFLDSKFEMEPIVSYFMSAKKDCYDAPLVFTCYANQYEKYDVGNSLHKSGSDSLAFFHCCTEDYLSLNMTGSILYEVTIPFEDSRLQLVSNNHSHEYFKVNMLTIKNIYDMTNIDNIRKFPRYFEQEYKKYNKIRCIDRISYIGNTAMLDHLWNDLHYKFEYHHSCIDIACASGHLNILEWFVAHGLELKYSQYAYTWADFNTGKFGPTKSQTGCIKFLETHTDKYKKITA